MRLLDTNVILRWLLDDDEIQSRAADKFIQRAFREKQKLLLSDLTVAELVWVMEGKGMIPEAEAEGAKARVLGWKQQLKKGTSSF